MKRVVQKTGQTLIFLHFFGIFGQDNPKLGILRSIHLSYWSEKRDFMRPI
jgi:hypothetical protein